MGEGEEVRWETQTEVQRRCKGSGREVDGQKGRCEERVGEQ